ncbi:MAG: hypothetical protein C4B59_07395 [Candidatus Methanogaster sp.]|uniref:Uncharacterized protein n=1 Tax=Candidatus Methanogaster sp. TaxID=3386292 RepID=A0AC61L304_9EURY|nr:MAG: hypothetical protein C4B59_07395 [ANME-2 cluster archaeon]
MKLFKEKEIEDVFVYIETVLRVFYESGRVPVLVIDELQVIGDTIYVHAGTYVENVDVDKERLALIGDGADVVTVGAADAADHVFEVTADWVSISNSRSVYTFDP